MRRGGRRLPSAFRGLLASTRADQPPTLLLFGRSGYESFLADTWRRLLLAD
ncbi:MAG TPA: hypothetical protein VIY52_04575 [Streptosporangiaceae bacterium]